MKNLKDTDMRPGLKRTNHKDQLFKKVILIVTHMVVDDGALLHQVFLSRSQFNEVINRDMYLENMKIITFVSQRILT